MTEFQLSYNPFTVETSLAVKIDEKWIPVSEESGLLRISRIRMQRWLEPMADKSFFEELREVSGEDIIDIYFFGTKEDLCDLQKAALSYMDANRDVLISVIGSSDTEKNSSVQKLQQLNQILSEAQQSRYKGVLPDSIWKYLGNCISDNALSAVLLSLSEWPGKKQDIFSDEAWQMVCFVFSYEELKTREIRRYLKEFSEIIEKAEDRFFDRERFLFICRYENPQSNLFHVVKKIFMEYGIQDINIAVLSKAEMELLDEVGTANQSEQYYSVQNSIMLFNERYAQQYRLRKIHVVLKKMLYEQGYIDGPKLLRTVEELLRGDERDGEEAVSDAAIKEAAGWISDFIDKINHLLDVNMEEDSLCRKGTYDGE